jgi:hypothetical protein
MRRVGAAAGVLGLLTLALAGCGDDGDGDDPPTTATTVTLGDPLAVGATYEDPTGIVSITVEGVRITDATLLASAEVCTDERGLPSVPIGPAAWQLRVQGREQTVPRVTLNAPSQAARPVWPDEVALGPGDCFTGKVAFPLPDGARPAAIVFTQLNQPVAWQVRT